MSGMSSDGAATSSPPASTASLDSDLSDSEVELADPKEALQWLRCVSRDAVARIREDVAARARRRPRAAAVPTRKKFFQGAARLARPRLGFPHPPPPPLTPHPAPAPPQARRARARSTPGQFRRIHRGASRARAARPTPPPAPLEPPPPPTSAKKNLSPPASPPRASAADLSPRSPPHAPSSRAGRTPGRTLPTHRSFPRVHGRGSHATAS